MQDKPASADSVPRARIATHFQGISKHASPAEHAGAWRLGEETSASLDYFRYIVTVTSAPCQCCASENGPSGEPPRMPESRVAIEEIVDQLRSEEHTSELQSLMRISYA